MRSIIAILVCLLSFSAHALDMFDLPGKSCEFLEENFDIKDERTINGKVILTLDGDSTASCDEDSFQLESVFITVYDVANIARTSGNFEGLNLFDIRKYKLLKVYPNLQKINDKTYQVLDNNKKVTFHFVKGKVLAITLDWSKDFEGSQQRQVKVRKQRELANELVSLYKRSLRKVSGYYRVKNDTIRFDNTSIGNDGCSINFSGSARSSENRGRIDFWLEYNFSAGIGWTNPSYTTFDVDRDTPGVYQGMIDDRHERSLSSLKMSSASDAKEAARIFRNLHKLCWN
ncbi:hypothetical protein [Halobacteriovorax sp.]|uniref:hypothetical protein n=1 Tax=Halobacteriovorax sp. TaxID=2020862 RepID=UPI003564CCD0